MRRAGALAFIAKVIGVILNSAPDPLSIVEDLLAVVVRWLVVNHLTFVVAMAVVSDNVALHIRGS